MGVGDQANASVFSYVAVGRETTFATYASATTAVEALSCGFQVTYKHQKLETMGINRGHSKRVMMEREVKGAVEAYLHPEETALMVIHALAGQVSSTAASATSYSHSVSAGNFLNSIPSLSFNVRKGGGAGNPAVAPLTWRYQGGRCNSFKMVGDIGQPVKCTWEMIFQDATQVSDDIAAILSISSVQPYSFAGATYKYGANEAGVAAENISHFELTINNNVKDDKSTRALGTATAVVLPALRRDIQLKTTQRFDTTTVYNRFIQGTNGAISLLFSGASFAASASAYYSMEMRFPLAIQATGDVQLKGPGEVLECDIDWDILVDSPATTTGRDVGLTIRNKTASY